MPRICRYPRPPSLSCTARSGFRPSCRSCGTDHKERYLCSTGQPIRGSSKSTSGRHVAPSSMTCWTSQHQILKASAGSDSVRPKVMTASSTVCRSRRIDRDRVGTCSVASTNIFRSRTCSSQPDCPPVSSTRSAAGMPRTRWQRHYFTVRRRTHIWKPGGNVVSTVMWRAPSGSSKVRCNPNWAR